MHVIKKVCCVAEITGSTIESRRDGLKIAQNAVLGDGIYRSSPAGTAEPFSRPCRDSMARIARFVSLVLAQILYDETHPSSSSVVRAFRAFQDQAKLTPP
jgi:hypothetical protein